MMDGLTVRKEIGENIRRIREGRHMTLDQFVVLYNDTEPTSITISRSALHKYETGGIRISAEKYQKILSIEG